MAQDIAIGAIGQAFDSQAGQIRQSVANGSPPLRCFFGAVLSEVLCAEMGPATRRAWASYRQHNEDLIRFTCRAGAKGGLAPPIDMLAPPLINKFSILKTAAFVPNFKLWPPPNKRLAPLSRLLWRWLCLRGIILTLS